MKKSELNKYIKILENHFGSHRNVAKELGIHEVHYRRIRNGQHPGSNHILKHIRLMAEMVPIWNVLFKK